MPNKHSKSTQNYRYIYIWKNIPLAFNYGSWIDSLLKLFEIVKCLQFTWSVLNVEIRFPAYSYYHQPAPEYKTQDCTNKIIDHGTLRLSKDLHCNIDSSPQAFIAFYWVVSLALSLFVSHSVFFFSPFAGLLLAKPARIQSREIVDCTWALIYKTQKAVYFLFGPSVHKCPGCRAGIESINLSFFLSVVTAKKSKWTQGELAGGKRVLEEGVGGWVVVK